MRPVYEASWTSLINHRTPQWLRDAKFGIYTHWGLYSVPACGPNGSWYSRNMYHKGTPQSAYHEKFFGPATEFGYKDFIPLFTAKKFDANEWAEIFRKSGAKFAGPVAEHHDGFSMWDSVSNPWNAAKMGPKKDIVGNLEIAIRNQGMKFMTAFHHFEQWWWYPHWRRDCDVSKEEYSGLYGPIHNLDSFDESANVWQEQDPPDGAFHNLWRAKIDEVLEAYRPDLIWFDFGLQWVQENYKKQLLADYYNKEAEWDTDLALVYKNHDLVPGAALVDYELGRMDKLTYYDWITDTSVDAQGAWGFVKDAGFKKANTLVHNLVDNVSKNGYLLLNVGPKADGTIPDQAKSLLQAMGDWLRINGEAVYGTTPWFVYGEGPTKMTEAGMFSEQHEVLYTAEDYRFTCNDNAVYATSLGWPKGVAKIKSMGRLYAEEISSVTMLGSEEKLSWKLSQEGLEISAPKRKPCQHAFVYKITRKKDFL